LRPKGYGNSVTFAPAYPPAAGTPTIAAPTCAPASFNFTNNPAGGDICAIADKYHIPCCQLKAILQVESGNGAIVGSGSCTRNGKTFNCCYGNFCGPDNVSCSQYSALNDGNNLDMCSQTDSAELVARSMLLSLCIADENTGKIPAGTCSFDWATSGNYVLQHYNINQMPPGSDGFYPYTAAAYYYGLGHGCAVDSCSQFRWGAGQSYCSAVRYYCENNVPLVGTTDVSYCAACNATIPAGSPKINCSLYQ